MRRPRAHFACLLAIAATVSMCQWGAFADESATADGAQATGGAQVAGASEPVQSDGMYNDGLPLPDSLMQQAFNTGLKIARQKANADRLLNAGTSISPPPTALADPIHEEPLTPSMLTATVKKETAATKPVVAAAPAVPPRPADPLWDRIQTLVHTGEEGSADFKKYSEAVDRYSDWKKRLAERSSDMLNYAMLFKGVSPSSEAGDIILTEKTKLKSLAAAKYMRQKVEDQIQMRVISDVMQIATGVGTTSTAGQAHIQQGMKDLTELVGAKDAEDTLTFLKQLAQNRATVLASRKKPLWSVTESQKRVQKLACTATESDVIVADIKKDVHHYNQHSKGAMAAHRVARTALSVASMTPDFVGPAAQVVLFTYLTVSGGTEQEKILRELYIDKRLTSRATLLYEEAHMALYNYQLACITRNSFLHDCSQRLVTQLGGPELCSKLLAPES